MLYTLLYISAFYTLYCIMSNVYWLSNVIYSVRNDVIQLYVYLWHNIVYFVYLSNPAHLCLVKHINLIDGKMSQINISRRNGHQIEESCNNYM